MIPTALPSPHHHHTTPLRLHHHQSPHHHLRGSTIINHDTTTSAAPPSSIITPPPPHHHQNASASHHTHYTIRKPKPISTGPQPLMNTEELMNPDADQPQSQQEKKKEKKKREKPSSTPIKTHTPPPLVSSIIDQPRSTTKIPSEQKQRLRRSTQINHQNPIGTKTHTSLINPNHNRKNKKKNPDQPRSTPKHRRR